MRATSYQTRYEALWAIPWASVSAKRTVISVEKAKPSMAAYYRGTTRSVSSTARARAARPGGALLPRSTYAANEWPRSAHSAEPPGPPKQSMLGGGLMGRFAEVNLLGRFGPMPIFIPSIGFVHSTTTIATAVAGKV